VLRSGAGWLPHELRIHPHELGAVRGAHESAAARSAHEDRLRVLARHRSTHQTSAGRPAARIPVEQAQLSSGTSGRRPRRGAHHVSPRNATALPDGGHPAARRPANQGAHVHHSRRFIHARHLARVRWLEELRQYRLEVRQWRRALQTRARLLSRLSILERRLAHSLVGPNQAPAPRTFEIEGSWFRQSGGRRTAIRPPV